MTQDEDVHIIGVKETDDRYGVPDFAEEKQRALTAGPDGGPVSDRAEEILEVLDDIVFIPLRREAHEVACYHQQIRKQGVEMAAIEAKRREDELKAYGE